MQAFAYPKRIWHQYCSVVYLAMRLHLSFQRERGGLSCPPISPGHRGREQQETEARVRGGRASAVGVERGLLWRRLCRGPHHQAGSSAVREVRGMIVFRYRARGGIFPLSSNFPHVLFRENITLPTFLAPPHRHTTPAPPRTPAYPSMDLLDSTRLDRPQVSESYRKLRNTLRYLSGSLFDFDPEKDSVPYEDLPSLDK